MPLDRTTRRPRGRHSVTETRRERARRMPAPAPARPAVKMASNQAFNDIAGRPSGATGRLSPCPAIGGSIASSAEAFGDRLEEALRGAFEAFRFPMGGDYGGSLGYTSNTGCSVGTPGTSCSDPAPEGAGNDGHSSHSALRGGNVPDGEGGSPRTSGNRTELPEPDVRDPQVRRPSSPCDRSPPVERVLGHSPFQDGGHFLPA